MTIKKFLKAKVAGGTELTPKAECHFYNGTEQVRYLERYFYNRQEYVHFDSDLGEYRALTELGWPDEKDWNSQEDLMEQKRAALNKFCRHNYWVSEGFSVQRKSERGVGEEGQVACVPVCVCVCVGRTHTGL
ncbi:HLA class II histocompatibility antigen, DRB1-4 beta chain [Myotis davidii]|uniref:HLA class II histocompatibility antigen, DRB1-4 beta chain n=1 Tax=Myotis davidii TaxID=225400 RepID=L5LZW8_MYODS|nr:HLA class II histocompatibility antigen, DRB1-4 beta chain [Myotis davidii]